MSKKTIFTLIFFCAFALSIIFTLYLIVFDNQITIKWSPDGEWIVFSCSPPPYSHLYIMRPTGESLQRLTNDDFIALSPTWSPDGEWIAFSMYDSIYKVSLNGLDYQEVLHSDYFEGRNIFIEWSPDGNWITFSYFSSTNEGVYKVRSDGSDLQTIVESVNVLSSPSWSPDGEWITFAVDPYDEENALYIVRNDGSEQRELASGNLWSPTWSPDGDNIAFIQSARDGFGLHVIDVESRDVQSFDLYGVGNPTWAPDGSWIAFSTVNQIYKTRAEGVETELIISMDCSIEGIDWFSFDK